MSVDDELFLAELKDRVRRYLFEAVGLIRNDCFFTAAEVLESAAKLSRKVSEMEAEMRKEPEK